MIDSKAFYALTLRKRTLFVKYADAMALIKVKICH